MLESIAAAELWRKKGKGPDFVKLGHTKSAPIRYLRTKIHEFVEAQSFRITGAHAPNAKHEVIRARPLGARLAERCVSQRTAGSLIRPVRRLRQQDSPPCITDLPTNPTPVTAGFDFPILGG